MTDNPDTTELTTNDERVPIVGAFLEEALAALADGSIPLKERAGWYAMLRPLRLKIDRALRPVTAEIVEAMTDIGATRWGPLRLVMKSKDVHYNVNDLGNWEDDGVQQQLGAWRDNHDYRPYIRAVPRHLEIDTIALRDGLQQSDPGAFELYHLLNEYGYRTTDGRTPTLTIEAK